MPSERTFLNMNYIYSDLLNRLTTKRAQNLQYIFINKRALEHMGPKEWTEEEMLLAEDMHLAEEPERREHIVLGGERDVDEEGDQEDEQYLIESQPPVTQNPAPIEQDGDMAISVRMGQRITLLDR